MLKQIAFGSIALTATGYGIKKLYEKLSIKICKKVK